MKSSLIALHVQCVLYCGLKVISAGIFAGFLFPCSIHQCEHCIYRQKDVIFDGTMMWAPFVEQTIAMVRDHQRNYRRGPGYKKDDNGHVTEQ